MSAAPQSRDVTVLLHQWRSGDRQALDELMPLVYDELRRIAARCMSSERRDHTLRATALVNEAYMRLAAAEIEWQDRALFFAVAANVLRRILVEYARIHNRHKRGSGEKPISLDDALEVGHEACATILDLDEALNRLSELDSRKSDVVQLMYFGGMTYEEIAEALSISPATVHRELKLAKAWLYREMSQ